jgi:POT family proton-dependent oligopeptide transporter
VFKTDSHGVRVLDAAGEPIKEMGPHPYFNNLPKDEWPPEGQKRALISTELFQSINPFFVVVLTPVVVGVWARLRRRGKEPSTPGKISIGLFITALSTLIMVAAVFATHNGLEKASAWWLVGTYGVITVGELCLSPMGLSLVSKLSPARLTSVMMGGWFLSTSIGNKLSGILSGLLDAFDHRSVIFFINFGGALFASILIALMVPRLRGVMKKYVGS